MIVTTADVCDHSLCTSSVLVIVAKDIQGSTAELHFCGHHYNNLRPALQLEEWILIHDDRSVGQRFEVQPSSPKGLTTRTVNGDEITNDSPEGNNK